MRLALSVVLMSVLFASVALVSFGQHYVTGSRFYRFCIDEKQPAIEYTYSCKSGPDGHDWYYPFSERLTKLSKCECDFHG